MRLLLIPLLISLTACGATTNTWSVNQEYNSNVSTGAIALNLAKQSYYTVPYIARAEHKRCQDFAIREMIVGQECMWEVPNKAVGKVKLVKVDVNNCHYMFNIMRYRGKQKHWQTTACRSGSSWIIR